MAQTPPSARAWCIVDDALVLGGAELFALRLGRALSERGDRVTIATPGTGPMAGPARELGLTVTDLALPRLVGRNAASIPGGVLDVRRVLSALRADDAIVVANTAGAQAYCAVAAATLRGVRLVHLMHEQLTAARRSARFVLAHAPAVVADGANAWAIYTEVLGRDDVGKLNNFLDRDAFADTPAPASASGSLPVVGILGRLIPEKGMLEAVDELGASRHAWSRALFGGPSQDAAYAAAVTTRMRELGLEDRMTVLGPVDVPQFLDGIDVLLVPSTGVEGQPTVILEALARRRPVVVRSHMASVDFTGLPVISYDGREDLGAALERLPGVDAAIRDEVARRFSAPQAIAALEAAAARATAYPR